MRKIVNLTMHAPTPEMVDWGERQGVRDPSLAEYSTATGRDDKEEPGSILAPENKIVFSKPIGEDLSGLADWQLVELACEQANRAAEEHAVGVLVGSRSDMAYYQIAAAHEVGLTVYVADTEHIRDENDRFVFVFRGLRRVRRFRWPEAPE